LRKLILPNNILLPEVEKLLSQGTEVTLKVRGNSMLPFIVGDRDSVVLIKAQQLKNGDIVLAHLNNSRYVLHRIIKINSIGVSLMGDGNIRGVEHCNMSDICGKVSKIIRNGNYIEIDSNCEICKARLWRILRPIRRYLLGIYRRIN
jgi:hypothetical protein